ASLAPCSAGTRPSVTSNGTTTASKLSPPESATVSSPKPQSSLTCVSSWSPVQLDSTEDLLTWLQLGSHASLSAWPENREVQTTSSACGLQPLTLFAPYAPHTFSLRTCLDLSPVDIADWSSVTWPKWGMMPGTCCWELTPLEPTCGVEESGL